MSPPAGGPVSVVVVSRGRPGPLALCVGALAGLDHPMFEIVVAADAPGLAALAPWEGRIKAVRVDAANISAARNAGLALAAGELVAFIDDDAVAEPAWLRHLEAAFADPRVGYAGGFVRGPSGPGIERRVGLIGPDATDRPWEVEGDAAVVRADGLAVKAEGTNMAARADVLRAAGGFDEGYRFWLDETDLCWRLARLGHWGAAAPLARVRHGSLPSERRRAGVALSLREVGASLAVWHRRHGLPDPAARLTQERAARRRTLLRQMVQGRVEPRDVASVLSTLDDGWAEGLSRRLPPPAAPTAAPPAFLAYRPLS